MAHTPHTDNQQLKPFKKIHS